MTMNRPILWRSADGRKIINVLTVAFVVAQPDGKLTIYTAGDRAIDGITLPAEDAASFMAALDDAAEPATPRTGLDPIIDIDAVIARLDALRADMATVGGNALVEVVRDLAIAIRSVGRG